MVKVNLKRIQVPKSFYVFNMFVLGAGVYEGRDDVCPFPDQRLRKRPQRRRHLTPQGSLQQPGKFRHFIYFIHFS